MCKVNFWHRLRWPWTTVSVTIFSLLQLKSIKEVTKKFCPLHHLELIEKEDKNLRS
jgi:hypothetical protein